MMTRVNYRVSCFVFGLFIAVLTGCGGDDGPTGATASLSWDPIMDSDFLHYTVHYGKQSSGDGGSCNYEHSVDVVEPVALVTGLEFDTAYYFAVSASNEQGRSQCSNEASKITPEAPPVQIGDPPVEVTPASPPHCDGQHGKSNNGRIELRCPHRED